MSGPRPYPSAEEIAAELMAASGSIRALARLRRREDIADLRFRLRRTQANIRLADAFAKLGGGSLLTATLLLIVNGQVTWPVLATALSSLLAFVASTIFLVRLDRQAATFERAAELIESALKETER